MYTVYMRQKAGKRRAGLGIQRGKRGREAGRVKKKLTIKGCKYYNLNRV